MHEARLVSIQLVEGESWPDGIRVGRSPLDILGCDVGLRDHYDTAQDARVPYCIGATAHVPHGTLCVHPHEFEVDVAFGRTTGQHDGRGSIDASPEQNGRHVVLLVEHERDLAISKRPVSGLSVTARARRRHRRHVLPQPVAERFGSLATLWRGSKEGEERVARPYTRVDTDARAVAAIGLPVGGKLVGDRLLVAGPIAGPREGSKGVHQEAQQEDGHPEHERKEDAEHALLRCDVQPRKRPTQC
eukprot:6305699-Prymnesium_polylepis.2